MKEQKMLEIFANIIFVSSDDPKISKWLISNKKEIDKFYEWSNAFVWKTK